MYEYAIFQRIRDYSSRFFFVGFLSVVSFLGVPLEASAIVTIKHSSDWQCINTDDSLNETFTFWALGQTVTSGSKWFELSSSSCSPFVSSGVLSLSSYNQTSGYRVSNASGTLFDYTPGSGSSFWSGLAGDGGLLTAISTTSSSSSMAFATTTYKYIFAHGFNNDVQSQALDIIELFLILWAWYFVGSRIIRLIKSYFNHDTHSTSNRIR